LIGNTQSSNIGIGSGADVSGSHSIAIGVSALAAGNNSIAIGAQARTTGDNSITIGNGAYPGAAASNYALIGNDFTTWIGGKVGWSTYSDARIKNTIVADVKGLDFILKLRPVTYHISNDAITALTGQKDTRTYTGKNDGGKNKI
jgi:hypothetical protein